MDVLVETNAKEDNGFRVGKLFSRHEIVVLLLHPPLDWNDDNSAIDRFAIQKLGAHSQSGCQSDRCLAKAVTLWRLG